MSLTLITYCLCVIFVVSSSATEGCNKFKCPGPLRFYDDLRCRPIYKNPGDCCAIRYDCSHLEERSPSKCFVNGNVYEIGEKLKTADAQPCDTNCVCQVGHGGIASFECAEYNNCGIEQNLEEGCYLDYSPDECCSNRVICPTNPVTCVVDGKTLKEGKYFQPKDQPFTSCYCKPGYKGENVAPFCHTVKGSFCGIELRHGYELSKKCAPVYYYNQQLQTSCNTFFRCQNLNDTLVPHPESREKSDENKDNTCTFGNIIMNLGDELNQATDYNSVCVKCKCEVPPIPTCQRLPDNECDITVHPKFEINYN